MKNEPTFKIVSHLLAHYIAHVAYSAHGRDLSMMFWHHSYEIAYLDGQNGISFPEQGRLISYKMGNDKYLSVVLVCFGGLKEKP